MPTPDEEFIRQLRATFQVEAEEHLQAIATRLLALEKAVSPADRKEVAEVIYREAHSLKGAARAVDLLEIETLCQAMETVFSAWKRNAASPPAGVLDLVHKCLDVTRSLMTAPASIPPALLHARDALLAQLAALTPPETTVSPGSREAVAPARESPTSPAPTPPQASHADAERNARPDSVRIPIAKLDAQLLRAEDLLPFKALTARRAREIRELVGSLEQWQTRWSAVAAGLDLHRQQHESGETPHATNAALSPKFAQFLDWNIDFHRSLERKLGLLAAEAERDRRGITRRLDELLEDSKKLLMLPFSTIAALFPKTVRDLCREQGKEADLVVTGEDVEIDKRILEDMKDALVHILRNSVDHGIETPAERAASGKLPRGTITLAISQVNGSKVEMLISDDGRGIDVPAVREAAMRGGARSPGDVAQMSDADALSLVFDSEVSTRRVVTTVSGRGLGMAIVRSKVESLEGRITLESTPGRGATLRILLPLTLATFRGILVTAAGRTFVIPAANVETALRLHPTDIQSVENREVISVRGRVLSLARLAAVLELPQTTPPPSPSLPVPTLILRAGGEHIAFAVDELLHEEEVLVKPLRKPLVRIRNIGGATILGNGRAVPTLNVSDLIRSARTHGYAASYVQTAAPAAPTPAAPAKRILVVEDSITSRMLLKGILESAGYDVQVAVDGMDAYTQLREAPFDLVVSDVEMPRLNGFDLTARIRADKRLADLPIVLVTALESRDQRERGIDAGASAYIVKSSFDQSNLLQTVRGLL